MRLTYDAWRLGLGGIQQKAYSGDSEQRCPFCMDCDFTMTPRPMHREIRYWNGWMIRMLLHHLTFVSSRNKNVIRKIPICRNETGYVKACWICLPLALLLTGFWGALIVWIVITVD